MRDASEIGSFLEAVRADWEASRNDFPSNTYPAEQWPIPFFGNPQTALVATIGVNPSSNEFSPERGWRYVRETGAWRKKLEGYFNGDVPPDDWFDPWRAGLNLLGLSYKEGTAAHFDVSFRSTKAMLRNPSTDRREFRQMVERDVSWLFRLLPLCPKLRGLLVYGPVVRHDGKIESLAAFVRKSAPRNGFSVLRDGGLGFAARGETGSSLFLHEVCASGRETISEQVVENLQANRDGLQRRIIGNS
ncbi:MAG: hypothetical protein U1F65_02615 [Verrucomicrobiota bacterium]